jgi:RNA 2',3'-cyclic 3'-phosphodiesterase
VTGAASVGGRERPRLFAALVLPRDIVERLVAWQRDALDAVPNVRVVPPANLHVTLAFLGPRPPDEIPAIVDELRAATAGAASPVLGVAGYRETRSVGMLTLEDDRGLAGELATSLHRRLEAIGVYEPERRRWLPHLTVVRFRRPPRLSPALPELGRFSPSEAAVYHSVLRPAGAQYEVVESVPLGS